MSSTSDDNGSSTSGIAMQALGSVLGIAGSLLAAHTARVHGATNENQAALQIVPAFDQDVRDIAQAYNDGTDPGECLAAAETVDAQVMAYLKAQVGKAGTAWNPTSTLPACNKVCTVGCCLYYNDLHRVLTGEGYGGGMLGFRQAIANGGGTVYVPKIYPSSYGMQARESYTLTLTRPPAGMAVTGAAESAVASILGGPNSFSGGGAPSQYNYGAPAIPSVDGGSLFSSFSNPSSQSQLLLVVAGTVIAGLILSAMMGGRR